MPASAPTGSLSEDEPSYQFWAKLTEENKAVAILVTGGAGFIGSHTCVELLKRGQDVLIIDDYSNSSTAAVEAIRSVSGKPASGALLVALHIDLRDLTSLDRVFQDHQI